MEIIRDKVEQYPELSVFYEKPQAQWGLKTFFKP